jgi:hypothetical protein
VGDAGVTIGDQPSQLCITVEVRKDGSIWCKRAEAPFDGSSKLTGVYGGVGAVDPLVSVCDVGLVWGGWRVVT